MPNSCGVTNLFTLAVLCSNIAYGFSTHSPVGPTVSLSRSSAIINTSFHRRVAKHNDGTMQLHHRAGKSSGGTVASATTTPASQNLVGFVNRQNNGVSFLSAETSLKVRGGEVDEASSSSSSRSLVDSLASFWGSFGVVYILTKAIVRVVPIALEPFAKGESSIPLTPLQMGAYVGTCAFFAYAEGYKGFQKKFAPLVVSRSFTLRPLGGEWTKIHHTVLAPLYSMGLFHATRKRMIVSWSVSLGVGVIVHAVKKLPYPWRNIVDAGVVVGLTWGAVSIVLGYAKGLMTGGESVSTDPALPVEK